MPKSFIMKLPALKGGACEILAGPNREVEESCLSISPSRTEKSPTELGTLRTLPILGSGTVGFREWAGFRRPAPRRRSMQRILWYALDSSILIRILTLPFSLTPRFHRRSVRALPRRSWGTVETIWLRLPLKKWRNCHGFFRSLHLREYTLTPSPGIPFDNISISWKRTPVQPTLHIWWDLALCGWQGGQDLKTAFPPQRNSDV